MCTFHEILPLLFIHALRFRISASVTSHKAPYWVRPAALYNPCLYPLYPPPSTRTLLFVCFMLSTYTFHMFEPLNAALTNLSTIFVVAPTITYGAPTSGWRMDESHKLNVMEIKCLQSMWEVIKIHNLTNEKVRPRVDMRKLTS